MDKEEIKKRVEKGTMQDNMKKLSSINHDLNGKIKELEEEISRLKEIDESGERAINNLASGQSREISLLKKQNEHMKEVLSAIGIIYSAYIKQE